MTASPVTVTLTVTVTAPTSKDALVWAQTLADLIHAEHGHHMRLSTRIADDPTDARPVNPDPSRRGSTVSDANPAIPEGFTLYDWLELLGFTWKIENEGYGYAAENYAPKFESQALKAIVADDDPRPLKNLYREHDQALADWQQAVGWEEVDRLWTAHLREEQERQEAHLLWAVHPGGDWNYHAYSKAFETREDVDTWIESRKAAVEKYGWQPWAGRILHRSEPGGEWTEVPTPAP